MSITSYSLIFAFSAMLLWGVGDFLVQKTVRKVGDFQTLLWINVIASLILLPFVIKDFSQMFSLENLIPLVFITVIDLFYGVFLFKAYDQGKLSVVEVVMIAELPFTIILGLIFFRERLDYLQTFFILLIIFGVFLMAKSRKTWWDKTKEIFFGKKMIWEKGIMLMFLAVIFSSLYNFLTAYNARSISSFTAIWFPWTLGSVFLLFYIIKKKGLKSFWREGKTNKKLIIITGLIDTAAWLSYALATERAEISIVTAIVAGYAVIAMLLGLRFNKERIGYWQYIGAVLVFIGVIVMSFIA